MFNKMLSREDHADRPFPRPAFNIDIIRVMGAFHHPVQMAEGFKRLAQGFGLWQY